MRRDITEKKRTTPRMMETHMKDCFRLTELIVGLGSTFKVAGEGDTAGNTFDGKSTLGSCAKASLRDETSWHWDCVNT